jgi:hypothetical protein
MTLKELAEKEGFGAKVTSPLIDKTGYWILGTPDKPNLLMRPDGTEAKITIGHLTATDWQVVEPETIEVGDVVRHKNVPGEAIAIGINERHCAYQYKDGTLNIGFTSDLTLIHKGKPKHVFEGVELYQRVDDAVATVPKGGYLAKTYQGKTYRMELTEEAE